MQFKFEDKRDDLRALLVTVVRENTEKHDQADDRKVEEKSSTVSDSLTSTSSSVSTKVEVKETESYVNKSNNSDSEESSDCDRESTMSENSSKIKFFLNKDKWDTFVERLGFQFLARDVTADAKKVANLLTSIDEDAYELIKHLCYPANLTDKKFDELTKLMKDHLNPKPSEVMERNNFYKAHQEQGESVADFCCETKKIKFDL